MKREKIIVLGFTILAFLIIVGTITFVRYKSLIKSNDNVVLSKWGIKISSSNRVYKDTYVKDKNTLVLSSSKTLAPNVKDQQPLEFKVVGESEVTSKITYSITGKTIYLKSGKYRDMTTNDVNVTFILDNDYYPIVYTLTKNNSEIAKGTLEDIQKVFNKSETINKNTNKNDVYKLSWEWAGTNDKADTYLSKVAEGVVVPTADNYNITESIKIDINLEQVN